MAGFPTRIKSLYKGVYNIQFSAQINKNDAGNDSIDIWLVKNDLNVNDTNTRLILSGNTNQSPIVASWNFIVSMESNDYVQLAWSSQDTQIYLAYIIPTGTPSRPNIPSVILTVQQVMYTQLGPTGATGPTGPNAGPNGTYYSDYLFWNPPAK